MMRVFFVTLLTSVFVLAAPEPELSEKSFRFDLEGALAWQDYNRNQIPNSSLGTKFDAAEFSKGPIFAPRFYLAYQLSPKHSLRALVFPFQTSGSKTFNEDIQFDGTTFAAGQAIQGKYRFHSYRLSYRYQFYKDEDWELKVGFTAKIRNALVSLSQNAVTQDYSNVGFVPLLYFNTKYFISPDWRLEFDMDALAAPQGRAEDVSISGWYSVSPEWELGLGYRTLEGGADNTKVFTFAWFHFVTLTAALNF